MKAQLLYIFFGLLLISCGGNRKASAETETTDPVEDTDFFVFDFESGFNDRPKATTLNDLIDSVSYIPLETHKDALLFARSTFAKIGDDMFMSCGALVVQTTPIYQFDSVGRFMKQIIYNGRGPNEVVFNMGWYANPNLKQINVVSAGSYMVVVNTETGDRSTVRINERQGLYRIPLNDSTFVSSRLTSSGPRDIPKTYLYFIDQTGNLVHATERNDELSSYNYTIREGSEWTGPYENYWLASDYKGDAIFHDIFNDTLYRIKSHREITPHLVFKRGALSPDPKDVDKRENRKKQVYFASVKESGGYVFLNYHHGGEVWCDVWSKRDSRLIIRKMKETSGPFADVFLPFALPDGSMIELQVVYADKDNIYCVLEALDACKFLPGIKDDDNPVIVVAKLKR